jgi:DNA-binding transcriptional ArsR family regulator
MNVSSRCGTNQPPRVNPSVVSSSGDPGPWDTPSSERNSVSVNLIPIIYNHMVVGARQPPELVDRVFHALADATRRDIVVRTLQAEFSVSALARLYPMSFAAVQKHVAVLERADLVTKRRHGREQLVAGNVDTIRRASRLLDDLEAIWRARIDRFGAILADEPLGGNPR